MKEDKNQIEPKNEIISDIEYKINNIKKLKSKDIRNYIFFVLIILFIFFFKYIKEYIGDYKDMIL